MPEENYSSISQHSAIKIIDFCNEKKIKTIYIQPHPNLGHRDLSYKHEFNKMVSLFKRNALKVIMIKRSGSKQDNLFFNLLMPKDKNNSLSVKYALTDISAMEMQFYNKKIPYAVLVNNDVVNLLSIPSKMNSYYGDVFISEEKEININGSFMFDDKEMHDYLLCYHKEELLFKSYKERISWLCAYTNQHRVNQFKKLQESY